jgi:DNA (cytosine-5)-methyltransferase 1
VVPEIRDAERLQGFPADWTLPAADLRRGRNGSRWRLVGNAVSVPVSAWLGQALREGGSHYDGSRDVLVEGEQPWPKAAWGRKGKVYRAQVSQWPRHDAYQHLSDFLWFEKLPLSQRATAGFLSRAEASTLRFPQGFLDAVARHLQRVRNDKEVA